tara:strand:- start:1670 stop:1948 length:279 start_codon:yes stop_codon:yes gene_type:complete
MRDSVATALNGTITINDTAKKTEDFTAYAINSDSVITLIEVNGDNTTNVVANYFTTPGSGIAKGGLLTPLRTLGHNKFSAITLSSGQVIGVK